MPSLGYGTFKFGRNFNTKYATPFELPTQEEAVAILAFLLENKVCYFDTAPAYGTAEEVLGKGLRDLEVKRGEIILSSKFGEYCEDGRLYCDFSPEKMKRSLEQSLQRLHTDYLDMYFIHANYPDVPIVENEALMHALSDMKRQGLIKAVGLSGYTEEAFLKGLNFLDAAMVEYHPLRTDLASVIETYHAQGKKIIIKKALVSGQLTPTESITFLNRHKNIDFVLLSSLNIGHLGEWVRLSNEG